MEVFIGLIIFIMGTFFGSFFTLAVYRIPLKRDITHEHSFCPNCNHKLGALDLVPIWSYLILGGKCRYCKEKIRIRYFLLEMLSGLVFLAVYISFKGNIYNIKNIEYMITFVFQYITLILIAGIDKEYRKINMSVLIFGGICQLIYMLYLYIVKDFNMYRYIIYFIIFGCMVIINKRENQKYFWQIVSLVSYILIIIGEKVIFFVIAIAIVLNLMSFVKKWNKKSLPYGFVMGIFTICYQIVNNFLVNYCGN